MKGFVISFYWDWDGKRIYIMYVYVNCHFDEAMYVPLKINILRKGLPRVHLLHICYQIINNESVLVQYIYLAQKIVCTSIERSS